MNRISLREYLTDCSKDELIDRLMRLDASIMALHKKGFYVVNFDANNIMLYNNELSFSSFNDKIDYLNSGINLNGDKKDILEMCAIGICAYNNFNSFYTNKEFLAYLIANFDVFRENGNIPSNMIDYYHDVFVNGNIDYLNNYVFKKNYDNASNSQVSSNSYRLSKSTAIGRAYDDRDSAFVNVLILPALIALVYLIILTIAIIC